MTDAAIKVENLGKRYRIWVEKPRPKNWVSQLQKTLMSPFEYLGASLRKPTEQETLWALKDVSFEVSRGEVVGVIGPNGAGKSTLLKVLTRITEPTEGRAEIKGRVGSLLEVGTGFHAELSGRDNVYLSGAILGMRRAEVQRKFDSIVGFAGVERFIDTPVKRYSSGMTVRLAFSVAAHLEPEVLLIDEVLAVGDTAFQTQCLKKMSEISGRGITVLYVSHNLETVNRLCQRCVLLQEGRIARIGTPQECIEQYRHLWDTARQRPIEGKAISLREHSGRQKPNPPVRATSLAMLDQGGKITWQVPCGGPMTAVVGYELVDGVRPQGASFELAFYNEYNQIVASCRSRDTLPGMLPVRGPGEVVCRVPRLAIRPGTYAIQVSTYIDTGWADGVLNAATIEVTGSAFYPSGEIPGRIHGEVLLDHEWAPNGLHRPGQ